MRKLFIDFDGTIIDNSKRIYTLFKQLSNCSNLSYDDYWELRNQGNNQKEMLSILTSYCDDEILEFKKNWIEKIENEELLSLDALVDGVEVFLREASCFYEIILWTNRQKSECVFHQINQLGISEYFVKVLVTEQKKSKKQLLIDGDADSTSIVIGDTSEDCIACDGITKFFWKYDKTNEDIDVINQTFGCYKNLLGVL